MLEVLMGSLEFVLSLLMSSLTIGRITDKSAHKICLQMTSIYNTTYIFHHIIIYPALIGTCAFSFILCSVYSSWIKRTEELWRLNQTVKQMDFFFYNCTLLSYEWWMMSHSWRSSNVLCVIFSSAVWLLADSPAATQNLNTLLWSAQCGHCAAGDSERQIVALTHGAQRRW